MNDNQQILKRRAERAADKFDSEIAGWASAYPLVIDGEAYVVTTGTGDGTFAYYASDIYLYDAIDGDYNDFCDAVEALHDEALAIEIYRQTELVIDHPGICMPVLETIVIDESMMGGEWSGDELDLLDMAERFEIAMGRPVETTDLWNGGDAREIPEDVWMRVLDESPAEWWARTPETDE